MVTDIVMGLPDVAAESPWREALVFAEVGCTGLQLANTRRAVDIAVRRAFIRYSSRDGLCI
jgi:hypothetical protein